MIRSICVFCGSSPGSRPAYAEAARAFGSLLASREIALVYGGGDVGLMGVIANAALDGGGRVEGVIPRFLMNKELGHQGLTQLHVTENMHERKARMAELSDAFVALPGGLGTMEELFEIWTWLQLALHNKPVGLLNVDGFYDPLVQLLAHMTTERFVKGEHAELVAVHDDPEALLEALARWDGRFTDKWLDRDRT